MSKAEIKEFVPTTTMEKRLLDVVKEQHSLLVQVENISKANKTNGLGGVFITCAIQSAEDVMYFYE